MARKISVSVNAVVTTALFIVVCCGFILFQKQQFDDLMQEYVDLKWESGNSAANLVIARNQLEACRAEAAAQP
jgi:hypothetical protein